MYNGIASMDGTPEKTPKIPLYVKVKQKTKTAKNCEEIKDFYYTTMIIYNTKCCWYTPFHDIQSKTVYNITYYV